MDGFDQVAGMNREMDNVKYMAEEQSISYTQGEIEQFAIPIEDAQRQIDCVEKFGNEAIAISFKGEKTTLIYMRTEFRLFLIQWVLAQGKYYMMTKIIIKQ